MQGLCNNYDTNISSQSGLKTTHFLATNITQLINNNFQDPKPAVPRLKKAELKNVKLSIIEMQRYKGGKKPLTPSSYSLINVLPLKVLCHQAILLYRSKRCDFDFLAATLTSSNIPDFNGYNTREVRMAGHSSKLKANFFFGH